MKEINWIVQATSRMIDYQSPIHQHRCFRKFIKLRQVINEFSPKTKIHTTKLSKQKGTHPL